MRWFGGITLSLTLLMGIRAPAFASPEEPETLEEFVRAVEATYEGVNSLGADFVQVTRSVTLGEEPPQRGQVFLARPQKMRWEFSGSDSRLFVTDGSQMWIYSPSSNQCHVYRDLGAGGSGMERLLTNLNQLDEMFEVEMMDPPNNQSFTLKLIPRQEANFKHLRLVISKKKYLLEQITIVDAFDNETELSFSQVRLNLEIPEDHFRFVPPEGVEVISPDGL